MPSIIDFSDEPRYTIKVVSVQTGIRPVTLRAVYILNAMLQSYAG